MVLFLDFCHMAHFPVFSFSLEDVSENSEYKSADVESAEQEIIPQFFRIQQNLRSNLLTIPLGRYQAL